MNKYFINYGKFTVAIFLFGICGVFGFGQTKEEFYRKVKGQILTSANSPEIRLKFSKKFKFAGSQKFILYDRAEAEQYFFVEAENKKIKRLYMLQFESFLPKIDGTYDYNEPQSVKIGGFDYFSNVEAVPNVEAALKAVPDSDIAKAAAFLQSKDFQIMKSLLYQRFVRVLGDDKRSEFIILYIEDSENVNSEKQTENLQKQALANFKILK
jgi:hypothetical protein